MKDLIEALTIFAKYTDEDVINCSHDLLVVCVTKLVATDDRKRLKELSFTWDSEVDAWSSSRFGSC